jgi:predicted RND superfamily exporter protein
MLWSYSNPIVVGIILVVVSVLSALQLNKLRIDASCEAMMMQGDPSKVYYEDTLKKFGTDKIVAIYFKDKDLFTPNKLKVMEEIARDLEKVQGVSEVESLFTVTNFKSEGDSLSCNPLMESVPDTQEAADQVKKDALRSPVLRGHLISKDGTATALYVYLGGNAEKPAPKAESTEGMDDLLGLDEGLGGAKKPAEPAAAKGKEDAATPQAGREILKGSEITIANQVDDVLKPHLGQFDVLFQIGTPYMWRMVTDMILNDQKVLIPLAAAVLLITLVASLRSLSGGLVPFITSGLSILWTLGFIAAIDIPINILTAIVPAMLIVIGSTEDCFLLVEYMEGVHETGTKDKAVRRMAANLGIAVLLTTITTLLGFFSICANQITALRQFGYMSSFGFLVNPLITLTFIPVYLRFFGKTKVQGHHSEGEHELGKQHQPGLVDRLLESVADWLIKMQREHGRAVLVVFFIMVVVFGLLALKINVDNDIMGFFRKDSPVVDRVAALHDNLSGTQTFYIRITSGAPGTFRRPENLAQVAAVQEHIDRMKTFDKSTSLADFIRLIHREMNGGEDEYYKVPDSPELISQYLLLLHGAETEKYVTPEFDEVNVVVRHNVWTSYHLKEALRDLDAVIKKTLNPHFKATFTGENILVTDAATSIIVGQAQGLSSLLLLVFFLMSLLFVNLKAGFLSLIPNVYPIAMVFGIMGIFGVPLNAGTCMVAGITLGIAVDDTIHFMSRYKIEMRRLQDEQKAVEECVRIKLLPVTASALGLAGGFAILVFTHFVPVSTFGILSAITIMIGVTGDLFLTPILLSKTQLITIWDMMALQLHKDVISASKLFRGLSAWQIKKVVLLGKLLEKKAGEYAVVQGEPGESMYLLLEGKATVFRKDEQTGKESVLTTLGPGDIFGEIALVQPGPRSAYVRADEPVQFIEITWASLGRMRKIFPRIANELFVNLCRILGERLVATTDAMLAKKG